MGVTLHHIKNWHIERIKKNYWCNNTPLTNWKIEVIWKIYWCIITPYTNWNRNNEKELLVQKYTTNELKYKKNEND